MTTSRSGVKVLHFTDREPLLVEGPTLVYRPVAYTVAYTVAFGEIVYSR
ncbi:hypothetical protein OG596_27010 [Streptomyces sp. NBC_01102]|nr:hypothetical protein OG596_27010 [Streptomyces sp. NBC_01102]